MSSKVVLGAPPAWTFTSPDAWTTAPDLISAVKVLFRSLMTKAPINWPLESGLVCTPATAPAPTTFWLDKAKTGRSLTRVMLPPVRLALVLPSRSITEIAAPTPAEPLPLENDKAPPPADTRLRS